MSVLPVLLLEGTAAFMWEKNQWRRETLAHAPTPCVVFFDQCQEQFISDPMPPLSRFERMSYARNRIQTLFPSHTLFHGRAGKDTLFGATAPLEGRALEGLQTAPLSTTLLGWELAKDMTKPTVLILTMPSGARRLYLFEAGAPLFARSIGAPSQGQDEALEATLYHIERHFQKPRASLTFLTWSAQDLGNRLAKRTLPEAPFESPWGAIVRKARLMHTCHKGAPMALALVGFIVVLQGVHLVHLRTEGTALQGALAQAKERDKALVPHPDTPLLKALPAFEALQRRPSPLTDLGHLAKLNTQSTQPQGVSWQMKETAPHVRFDVCATQPLSHADLEEAVRKTLTSSGRTYHLTTGGVVNLDDPFAAPPCLTGESHPGESP